MTTPNGAEPIAQLIDASGLTSIYDEWPCADAERFRGAARRAIARIYELEGDR